MNRYCSIIAAMTLLPACSGCTSVLGEAVASGASVTARHSVVGLDLAPMGRTPESPRLSLGSTVAHFGVIPATDGALKATPMLSRIDVQAPGVRVTETTAGGSVGDEFNEHVSRAIEILHASDPFQGDAPVPD